MLWCYNGIWAKGYLEYVRACSFGDRELLQDCVGSKHLLNRAAGTCENMAIFWVSSTNQCGFCLTRHHGNSLASRSDRLIFVNVPSRIWLWMSQTEICGDTFNDVPFFFGLARGSLHMWDLLARCNCILPPHTGPQSTPPQPIHHLHLHPDISIHPSYHAHLHSAIGRSTTLPVSVYLCICRYCVRWLNSKWSWWYFSCRSLWDQNREVVIAVAIMTFIIMTVAIIITSSTSQSLSWTQSVMHGHTVFRVIVWHFRKVAGGCRYVWLIPCIRGPIAFYPHTQRAMQMLAKPLRVGRTVNKKWRDVIWAAGNNQTACHSPLAFTGTETCRSLQCCCCSMRRILSYSVCMSVYKCLLEPSPVSPVNNLDLLSLKASMTSFSQPSFISIFGITPSLMCCYLHCLTKITCEARSAAQWCLLLLIFLSQISFCLSFIQSPWLLLSILTLFKTKHHFHHTRGKTKQTLDVYNKRLETSGAQICHISATFCFHRMTFLYGQ